MDKIFDTPTEVLSMAWPGPLSVSLLRDAYAAGWTLERWTPQEAVFRRGEWSEVVLKPALQAPAAAWRKRLG